MDLMISIMFCVSRRELRKAKVLFVEDFMFNPQLSPCWMHAVSTFHGKTFHIKATTAVTAYQCLSTL